MGVALRYVIAQESGSFARIPTARWNRAFHEKESLPEYAGQELRVIEVALEVHERVVERVIRVLPFRIKVRLNGYLDIRGHAKLASRRLSLFTEDAVEPEHMIATLELDANYFWELEQVHWRALSNLLRVPRDWLEQRIYRPPSQ
jgi:hypothetical protein